MILLAPAITLSMVMTPSLPSAHADAFTSEPFGGNPACVVLLPPGGGEKSDLWMQKVADEMHLSETAFLTPLESSSPSAFVLRWFTPTEEVDLCGHATLASSHILWEVHGCDSATPLEFHTRSGLLTATRSDDGWISLNFPAEPAEPVVAGSTDRALLLKAFPNLSEDDILFAGRNSIGGPGGGDLIVEVPPAALASLEFVASDVKKLMCRVLSVTCAGCPPELRPAGGSEGSEGEYAFTSRAFAPCVGVDEDPVCGSAHCCLGARARHRPAPQYISLVSLLSRCALHAHKHA